MRHDEPSKQEQRHNTSMSTATATSAKSFTGAPSFGRSVPSFAGKTFDSTKTFGDSPPGERASPANSAVDIDSAREKDGSHEEAGMNRFQVRVALIALSGITTRQTTPVSPTKKAKSKVRGATSEQAPPPAVTAFASLVPQDRRQALAASKGSLRDIIIPSLPLKDVSSAKDASTTRHAVAWPNEKTKRNKRDGANGKGNDAHEEPGPFLYTSALLRPEEEEEEATTDGKTSLPPPVSKSMSDTGANSPTSLKSVYFVPEIINIHIGVKRGEETIDLGEATFVVSGHQVKRQRFDLPVRVVGPRGSGEFGTALDGGINGAVHTGGGAGSKKGGLSRLFGGGKKGHKTGQPGNCFQDDTQIFSLAPNATVRICLDVKRAKTNDASVSKSASFWEGVQKDEILHQEPFVLHAESEQVSVVETNTPVALDPLAPEAIEVMSGTEGTTVISSPSASQAPKKQGGNEHETDEESTYTNFVIKNVEMPGGSNDVSADFYPKQKRQVDDVHQLMANSFFNKLMCGGNPAQILDDIAQRSNISESVSFESTLPDYDDEPMYGGEEGLIGRGEYDGRKDEGRGPTSQTSRSRGDSGGAMDLSRKFFNQLNVSTETEDARNDEYDMNKNGAKKLLKKDEGTGSRKSDVSDDLDENDDGRDVASVGEDTLESLKIAKSTLRRYASRVGVKVEDLLEVTSDASRARSSYCDSVTYDSGTFASNTYDNDSTIGSRTFGDGSTL